MVFGLRHSLASILSPNARAIDAFLCSNMEQYWASRQTCLRMTAWTYCAGADLD
jgi:hypothetical protein